MVKTNINFFQLQEILFSSPEIKSQELTFSVTKEGKYSLNSDNIKYTISKFFRVDEMVVSNSESHQLTISFNNYTFFDEIKSYYPKNLKIEVISNEDFSSNIDFSKIIFNKKSSINFKIPSSYVKSD